MPSAFEALSGRRTLFALAVATALLGAAMLPAMRTMEDHGASLVSFEVAGSVARGARILAGWGVAGKTAAWWQLGLDTLFLFSYGALLAGGCAALARRARAAAMGRLECAAAVASWLGPLAATADLAQNISLALILAGRLEQPWPRISAIADPVILGLAGATLALIVVGAVAISSSRSARVRGEEAS